MITKNSNLAVDVWQDKPDGWIFEKAQAAAAEANYAKAMAIRQVIMRKRAAMEDLKVSLRPCRLVSVILGMSEADSLARRRASLYSRDSCLASVWHAYIA